MPSVGERFTEIIESGTADELKAFLKENPDFDITKPCEGSDDAYLKVGFNALHLVVVRDHMYQTAFFDDDAIERQNKEIDEIIKILLTKDLTIANKSAAKGSTPLAFAAMNNCWASAAKIYSYTDRTTLSSRDQLDMEAIDYLYEYAQDNDAYGKLVPFLEVLIKDKYIFDLNRTTKSGDTIFNIIAKTGDPDLWESFTKEYYPNALPLLDDPNANIENIAKLTPEEQQVLVLGTNILEKCLDQNLEGLYHLYVNSALHDAREIQRYMARRGVDLIEAAKNNKHIYVKILLNNGADLNKANKNGSTALMWAAEKGHTDTAQALINAGADLNKANKNGSTALMLAAKNGHTDTATALIKAGADLNRVNQDGYTVLMWAAKNGHTDTATALIKAGVDVNQVNQYGNTALTWAANKGHTDAAKALIKAGADLNRVGQYDFTALMWAAKKGHTDTVTALIKAGADVNARDIFGNTALMWAAKKGHTDIAQELFEKRGNKVLVDDFGKISALNYQCSRLLNYVGWKNEVSITKKDRARSCHLAYTTFLPPIVIVTPLIIPLLITALVKCAVQAIKGEKANPQPDQDPIPVR